MSNEELVMQIKAGNNENENMLQLYNQIRNFIYKLAKPYVQYAEIEDLMQEGYLALYKAVERYDQEEGVLFLSYASHWIKQGVQRYIDTCCRIVRIPVHAMADIAKYNRLVKEYSLNYGEPPTDWQIAHCMGMSVRQIERLKKDVYMSKIASLDKPAGEEQDSTLGDLVPGTDDIESSVLDHVEHEQLKAVLWDMVDNLPDNQGEVIRKRYKENMTLDAIGNEYGVTRERIRTIESNGLRVLRRSTRSRKLKPFAEEYITTHAYRGIGVESFNRTWTSATEYVALGLLELEE